ncbi:MAG: hypothetical protein KDJ77_13350 [Rhodobiaceae bacterium]|nr:hypothetical protein [Rhodobiaceae bacterium]
MAKPSKPRGSGASIIKAQFKDALRELGAAASVDDPDPNLPRDGVKPGQWPGAPWDRLPPGCPITIMGHHDDKTIVVSAGGSLHQVEKFDMQTLARIFAPYLNFMLWAWPGWSQSKADKETGETVPPKVVRLERDKCMMAIIKEAELKGPFDPATHHRGRGGWALSNGGFLWHSGDAIWTVEGGALRWASPSAHDGFLYTRQPAIQAPWQEPVPVEQSPVHALLRGLRTWTWERPALDPLIYIGWLATGYMGGAGKVRPIIFCAGGFGVGKTTLRNVALAIYGSSVLETDETTEAFIRQSLQQDCIPVVIDENESRAGDNRSTRIVELARISYSGGKSGRGGQDGTPQSTQLRSAMSFFAINPPPMNDQDRSRMAPLNLRKLSDAHDIEGDLVLSEEHGRMMLRQIMDGWSRFAGELLPEWRRILHLAGLTARAQDTYGTLLAAAQLVLGDQAMEEALGVSIDDPAGLGELVSALTASERAEQRDNWEKCLGHIFDSTINAFKGGEKPTVGATLEDLERNSVGFEIARERLAMAGLGLRNRQDPFDGYALMVPTKRSRQLDDMFDKTEWHGGVWVNALKQAPDEIVVRRPGPRVGKGLFTQRINKDPKHCLLVDLAAFDRWVDENQAD